MKTTSVGIENLCVPCQAFCRYCLLSSCGKGTGIDYARGKRFAERFLKELNAKRPDLQTYFYIGYCMDDGNLEDYISFSRKIKAPSGNFLQMNGLRLRGKAETVKFIQRIQQAGIETVDLTFYGTREYHDKFAGRAGDFEFLLALLDAACNTGLRVSVSIPITKENIGQADCLLDILDCFRTEKISLFLPHAKGRGRSMVDLRLTADDLEGIGLRVKEMLAGCRTEADFLRTPTFELPQRRSLILSLQPDNIDRLESMNAEEILNYLENLDDHYYSVVPSAQELAARYGDPEGKRLYRRFRDLYLEWQQRFLAETKANIWDMNDETHHFSVRYE